MAVPGAAPHAGLATIVASWAGTGGWTVVGCTVVASSGRTGGRTLLGWTAAGWMVVACPAGAAPILGPSSIVAGPEELLKSVALPS
jgi:hypothetical protein